MGCISFQYKAFGRFRYQLLMVLWCTTIWGGCQGPEPDGSVMRAGDVLMCSAEETLEANGTVFFTEGSHRFHGGKTRSDERHFHGSYSSRLDSLHPYSLKYTLEPVGLGEAYAFSVWRDTNNRHALLVVETDWGLYFAEQEAEAQQDGWEQLVVRLVVNREVHNQAIRVYTWLPKGHGTAYVDQLEIRKLRDFDIVTPESAPDSLTLSIKLKPKALRQVLAKRQQALQKGQLITDGEDYVKTSLRWQGEKIKASLRLKGDWTDHLIGTKWSMRIKTKKKKYWNGMRRFSIQSPSTRSFLDEWLYHQWLEREDVLTPRYGLLYLRLNDTLKGVMAWEEHFAKQLVEHRKRREGPILRFNEQPLWDLRLEKDTSFRPVYEASTIEAFQPNSVRKSATRMSQFLVGQNLLYQFKHQLQDPDRIFDLDILARYLAIVDLTQAYHGLIWHNQRWYYNPVNSKLEPIGFDGFASEGPAIHDHLPVLMGYTTDTLSSRHQLSSMKRVFAHPGLFERYIAALRTFSSEAYLDNLLNELGPELARNEALLRTEYLHYSFDRKRLLERAAAIREELAGINMEEELAQRSGDFERPIPPPPKDTSATLREEVSVMAHSWSEQASPGIQLRNFHHQRVRVVGGTTGHGETIRLSSPWIAPYVNGKPAPQAIVMTPVPVVQLTVEAAGNGPDITIPIIDHVAPQDRAPAQAVLNRGASPEQFGTLTDTGWVIRPGRHALNQHLVIPAGTALHIGPGTTLGLHKGANIIAYSPVYLTGTQQAPVAVISSDRTGGGLAVLQAGKPSRLEHVQFKGLNTLDINGWTLTGAVTFYESDVTVNRVSFSHAQCEDALNIIRSEFTLTQCDFDHSYADAFDADFCQGEVADCRFTQIGNDGLDFSGSTITVTRCTLQGISDKAVSVGEQSTARLDGLSVEGAKVGFTAKDLSHLEVHNCQLAECRFVYAAFQKKPEFGPATMRLVGLTTDQLTGEYVIQQGSQLETDDGTINGSQDLDIDQLFYDK